MTIRVCGYNAQSESYYGITPHGLVSRVGVGAEVVTFPDRGSYAIENRPHAFPLCKTENFLICTRLDLDSNIYGTAVYAAPLRNTYTYSTQWDGQDTIGIQGFLYEDGYTPDIADEGDVFSIIPGTSDVDNCQMPMAVWLGGDKALVLWNESGGQLLMAMCEPTMPSAHRRSVYYASIPTPLAVGVDTGMNLRIAARFGTAIRISDPIPIASFGASSADIPFTVSYPHPEIDERTDMYSAIAALADVMGSGVVKIVGFSPLILSHGEGENVVGAYQVVAVPPNTGGSIAIYTPEPYDGIDVDWPGAGNSTMIYQGEMSYTIAPTVISFELTLPTEWWDVDAAMGSRWVAVPLSTFFAADSDLVVPVVPPFWQNLVKAQERL